MEQSDFNLASPSRVRSHSLELPGLTLPSSHAQLQPSLNETRDEKLDRFHRILNYADRNSLAHFLDEVAGDVDEATELFLQKSQFSVTSDGSIRRLNPDSAGPVIDESQSPSESPSSSPVRRSRLSRMMGGLSSNLSPTKSLRLLFDRDKDKEKRSLSKVFDKDADKADENQKEKRKSVLDDPEFMNAHDRGIEDLLKLLDREEPTTPTTPQGDSFGRQRSSSMSPASLPDSSSSLESPKKATGGRSRGISFSLGPKTQRTMKKSASTPFPPESSSLSSADSPPAVSELQERRVFSSDSLPAAISRRVFLENLPFVPFPQQSSRSSYSSEGQLGSLFSHQTVNIPDQLRLLVNTPTANNQRKRLFYALETLTSECVYVQVLEVLATVYVKPLYQAIVDKQPIITLYEMQAIFSALVDVPRHHLNFFVQFQQRLQSWTDRATVGDLFADHINRLAPYKLFASNLPAARAMVLRCLLTNSKFEVFCEDAVKDPLSNGIPLRELLDTPLLRVPRYKMLLKDLLGCTDQTHPDFQKLAAAYNNIKILDETMETLRGKESATKRLAAVLQSIQDCPVRWAANSRLTVAGISPPFPLLRT